MWFAFGFIAVPVLVENVGWPEVAFAVLALTVLRMVPVALALLGTGFKAPTVAFVGWFGPRGLASVVFTLLALEGLELDADLTQVVATICLTVLLSVLAHGLSADPLARRYGAWVERTRPAQELGGSTEPRSRRSLTPPGATLVRPRRAGARHRPDGIRPTLDSGGTAAMPRANAEHPGPTTALNAT